MLNAGHVMSRFVITVGPDSTIAELAKIMVHHAISGVPVVDDDGTLLGLVSEGDLVRQFTVSPAQGGPSWLSRLIREDADPAPEIMDACRRQERRAREMMKTGLITAPPDAGLPEIAALMEAHRVKRIPIVREGKLLGIVTRADLVKTMARAGNVAQTMSYSRA
jgi:CBS domain-containing protein